MSRNGRKPWQIQIQYEEDRFPEKPSRQLADQVGGDIKPDPDLVQSRVDNPLENAHLKTRIPKPPRRPTHEDVGIKAERPGGPRPSWRDAGGGRSNDDAPLRYDRGPHDGEIDVDDRDDPNYD